MISKYMIGTNQIKPRALQLAEEQLDLTERLDELVSKAARDEAESQRKYDPIIELAKNARVSSAANQLRSMKEQKVRNEQNFRNILKDISNQQDRLDELIVRELKLMAEEFGRKEWERERREEDERRRRGKQSILQRK